MTKSISHELDTRPTKKTVMLKTFHMTQFDSMAPCVTLYQHPALDSEQFQQWLFHFHLSSTFAVTASRLCGQEI